MTAKKTDVPEISEPNSRAIDGLLREFGRNGAETEREFVARIMSKVRVGENEERIAAPVIEFNAGRAELIKFIIPAAACLVIAAGLLALFFSGRMQNGRAGIKNQKAEACLLVSTPGGLITRQGQQQAITNGTKIYTDDTIKTFASSTAFMQFNDLSRIEIGSGSIIKYDGTRVLKAPGNKTENKITVALEDGAIYGDIVRNSDYGSFTVTTSQGKILTQDGKFILISTGQLFYLEVTAGTVHFKGNAEAGSVKLTAGQICTAQNGQPEIIAKARLAALPVSSEIAMNRKRLTLDDSGLERLLVKLYKQKKVDICLRSRHRTNRLFL